MFDSIWFALLLKLLSGLMFFVLSLFLLLGKWWEDVDDAYWGHSSQHNIKISEPMSHRRVEWTPLLADVSLFYFAIMSILAIFLCKEMYLWDDLLCYVNLGDVLCDVIWWMILIWVGVFLIWIWNSVGFHIGQIIGLQRPNK